MGMEASNVGWFWFSSACILLKGEAEKWKQKSFSFGPVTLQEESLISVVHLNLMNKPTTGSTLRMESRQWCNVGFDLSPAPRSLTADSIYARPNFLSTLIFIFNLRHFLGQQLAAAVPVSQHSWFQTQILANTEGTLQHIKWVKVWVNWVCHGQILPLSSIALPPWAAVVRPGSLLLLWYIWAMQYCQPQLTGRYKRSRKEWTYQTLLMGPLAKSEACYRAMDTMAQTGKDGNTHNTTPEG